MAFGIAYCGALETEIQPNLYDPLHTDPEACWASSQRARVPVTRTRNNAILAERAYS
jgi:hypothetical protein